MGQRTLRPPELRLGGGEGSSFPRLPNLSCRSAPSPAHPLPLTRGAQGLGALILASRQPPDVGETSSPQAPIGNRVQSGCLA